MNTSGVRSPLFFVINTAAFLLVSALAAAALWPIYASRDILLLIIGALCAGALVAVLGALYRWSSATVLFATVAVFLALGTPLALPGQAMFGVLPTAESLLDLLRGAGLGWKQLLTITLPVGGYQQLLVPAFILVLLSTVIGLSLTLRARYGELGVLAPTVLFIAAIAFGPDVAAFPVELALAFLVVSLLWFVWLRWYRRTRAIRTLTVQNGAPVESVTEQRFGGARTLLGAVATIAVALMVSAAAVVVVPPTGTRDVLRTVVEQPFDPRVHASPLAGFRYYLQQGRDTQTQLTVTDLPREAGLRIATLDSYDGVVYSVGGETGSGASGTFTRVPYELDQSGVDGDRVIVEVTVDSYSGVWLPILGKLESVEFGGPNAEALEDSFFYNDVTGTAVVTTGLRAGDSYRLTTVVPRERSEDALESARPGTAVVPDIGALPDELVPSLQRYIAGVNRPGERLLAMLDGLRADGYVSHGVSPDEPFSRSGHSADRISQLLTERPMIGDAEQYAVTAALMATELGFPARVVFGLRPDADDRESAPADGMPLTGSDVTAWIEVDTLDGWVSLDPNPEVRDIPEAEPDEPTVVSRPQSILPPPEDDRIDLDDQLPPETSEEEQEEANPFLALVFGILRVTGWVLLALAVLTSPFLAILAAKLRRRRRRRRDGTPLDRIQGGWQEFADTAIDHGYEIPRSSTRIEVAETVGGTAPLALARAADRAAFGPAVPDERSAEQVWRVVGELRAALSRGRSRRERIGALMSMRSLRRHGSRLPQRPDTVPGTDARTRAGDAGASAGSSAENPAGYAPSARPARRNSPS
ncbi:DUF3488 and transglutaminase-like domain-containing protein [Planctomonas psychrotolerans]|uniref:DUF3488 and transglutaminase-like domain-containing protein n=1 Tax=Planctomonas psychrotolerans TaxID=2528712 RepID=UPI0012392A25|nr:transglutaminase domain-containing protein [Planctomonas psychrotolerans]